ncbi:DUF2336 domain-containing protein [Aliihoeflea aestuarii]|uniref:DUF2336 domain-containing protein n=1 Tax=Aliihoeflea aestuarii TaxID=453840 RepID=UPI00209206E2|nr:DUF2336 domain-containing protein [Aliihoeflea aestuarii]MCO6390459.1 DUF2336 domain-containing protein [Aliihoeflea aestuarii]
MTTATAERFLRSTRAADRATAAEYLANLYLDIGTFADERHAAECALTLLADDPSPKVRAAIATSLAGSSRAPLHIVLHLAKDQPGVAGSILLRSPLLGEGDLIELAATLDAKGQTMIARRPALTARVAAALCELGALEAVIELARNEDADILAWCFRRMVERFGTDGELREILIRDPRLPIDCRHRLLASLGDVLRQSSFVCALIGTDRAARVTRDACARSSVSLIDRSRPAEFSSLVDRLRQSGELTTALVLRCIAGGKVDFFGHLAAHLASIPQDRVRTLIVSGRDLALVALFDKAGFAPSIHPPLTAAIHLWRASMRGDHIGGPREASQVMIDCLTGSSDPQSVAIVSLLRQIQSDAIRASAIETSRSIAA